MNSQERLIDKRVLFVLHVQWLFYTCTDWSTRVLFGLHLYRLVYTCTDWSKRVLIGLHVYWLVYTCTDWSTLVLIGIHVYWLVYTCTDWSTRVLIGLHVYWLVYTCTDWYTRVLIGLHLYWLVYTCTDWSLHNKSYDTLADLNKSHSFSGKPIPRFGFKLKFKVKKQLHLKTDNLGIKRLDFKIVWVFSDFHTDGCHFVFA